MQFEQAEYARPEATACTGCQAAIAETYFEVNGKVVCPTCQARVQVALAGGSGAVRYFTALGYGLVAAAAGAGIYFAVRAITGYELGLVAIVVGLMVGNAVKKGSEARGGWVYQSLAMFLTYTAIVMTYVPELLKVLDARGHSPSGLAMVLFVPILIGVAYAVPFLAGIKNIVGLLIIGFALYEAWKLNKRVPLRITGPYKLAARTIAPAPVAPVAPGGA